MHSQSMIKAFQWDLARQVERLDFLQKQLPRYAAWGYQELYLHLEDAVHYPSLPGIGRDDAYSFEELGELVFAAAKAGIRTVPILNLLGHTQYLIKHPDLRDLNELRDERGRPLEKGQICPLHPRTLQIAETLLRDMAPYCTAGKVHVGLDESFHLGKCPRCREEVARIGLGAHFAGHVQRLNNLCKKFDLQLGLWADMLYFVPEAIPLLPAGIIAYDWYYYPFRKLPRVELYNFAERDLATPLKKQGIQYYGCPMNGAFRYEPLPVFGDRLANLRSWWRRCAEVKAEGFLVTSWEAYRLALETTTVVDAAAANLWLQPEADDAVSMLAEGLKRVFPDQPARPLARQLLAADEKAFCGYARWQINDRWDTFAGHESLKPYEAELRFFRRLAAQKMPPPFAASMAFRVYLAARDVFVRKAARDVFKLRRWLKQKPASDGGAPCPQGAGLNVATGLRACGIGESGRQGRPPLRTSPDEIAPHVDKPARPEVALHLKQMQADTAAFTRELRAGRKAARAMWNRTRDPQARSQNEKILDADEQRLAAWRDWLKRVKADQQLASAATPVCGTWQLNFWVHNFAPAVQKVAIEQQQPDDTWRELASRYTIEFRAKAARPTAKIRREFSVPVDSPTAKLRITLQGVGQVAISHVTQTNGVVNQRALDWTQNKNLGEPTLTQGLPNWGEASSILTIDIE